jgi:OmpA-OmpF porin, OOP family
MNKLCLALGALLLPIAGPALADADAGLYLGGGFGDFSTNINNLGDVGQLIDFDVDEDATEIFAGWRFSPVLAVQLDYTDFGKSTNAVNLLDVTTQTKGWTPSVVGTLPLGPVELFGRAGMIFYDVTVDTPNDTLVDASGNDPMYGVGVGGTVLDRLSLRAEYDRVDIDELDDTDAFWLTAAWRF